MRIKLNYGFTLLILFFLSCRNESNLLIDDQEKSKVLQVVLKDIQEENNTVIIAKKNLFKKIPLSYYDKLSNDFKEVNSFDKFLSKILKVEDVIFISNQLKNNMNYEGKTLSKLGFNIIEKNVDYKNTITVLVPIFNKTKTLSYVQVSKGSNINAFLYKRKNINSDWYLLKEIASLVE